MRLKINYDGILQNSSIGLLFPKKNAVDGGVREREREMQRVSKYIAALSGIKHRVWHMNIADPEEGGRGMGSRPPLENHKYIQSL